jgi:hypothetical protein
VDTPEDAKGKDDAVKVTLDTMVIWEWLKYDRASVELEQLLQLSEAGLIELAVHERFDETSHETRWRNAWSRYLRSESRRSGV